MTTPLGFELPPDETKISAFAEVMRKFATTADRILTEKFSAVSTGWRNITALVTMKRTAGTVSLMRTGPEVTLNLSGLIPSEAGAGTILTLPAGFRPSQNVFAAAQGASLRVDVATDGQVRVYDWAAGRHVYCTLTYPTAEAWPAALPGTA